MRTPWDVWENEAMVDVTAVRVRVATAQDEDAVWPLARDLATSFVAERKAFGRSFRHVLADEAATVLVAVDVADQVVGYAHVLVHPAFHANGNIAWVEEVMVSPRVRGSGCGKRLVAAAEQWAVEVGGVAYVALATRRAASFYRVLGYEESAVYFTKTV